jgi:hypothetical protein
MRAMIVAAVLALAAPAEAAETSVAGAWGGQGVDTRGDQFDIKLAIHADGSAAIVYDGVFENQHYDCAGSLLPISASARRLVFREAILTGDCISGAEVTLFRGKDGLGFSWRAVWEEKGLTAQGTLKRLDRGG